MVVYDTFGTKDGRGGVFDTDRSERFHPGAGDLRVVGSGHRLASLLSGVDVRGHDGARFAPQSLGIFHRNIRSRFVGLRKHLRDKLFLEWSAATGSVIHTGNLARPDLLIAVPAWFSNLLVIIGCVWACSRLEEKHASDAVKFLVCFVLTTGFFAADMAIFQPRYLGLFPRMVHPHLPF
ncbi:MAG: hypothetical protein WA185_17745 [Candidatus Acidiferrales bacterium]